MEVKGQRSVSCSARRKEVCARVKVNGGEAVVVVVVDSRRVVEEWLKGERGLMGPNVCASNYYYT